MSVILLNNTQNLLSINLAKMLIMLYNKLMKKEIKDKLKEVISFIVCIIVLLAIAYYSGFINGFTVADFQNAYNKIVYSIGNSASKTGVKSELFDTNNSNGKRFSKYKNYQPMNIPAAVLRGVESSGTWRNIFYSDKKVIFYIYNDSQLNFHNSVKNYLSSKSKASKYYLSAYTEGEFSSMRLGDIGPSKICDSLEECNAVRQKASDYTSLSEFMKQCGRYMCIINPAENQYIKLRNKNSGQAVKMIYDLMDW